MEQLRVDATLPKIAPGDLAEFKRLAAQAIELAKGEPGTVQYDWFLSDDETKCAVRATYENADAQLTHMANMGELMAQLAGLGGGLEIAVFGDPSPQFLEATAALRPTVYKSFAGK